jgi:hypothetical protein
MTKEERAMRRALRKSASITGTQMAISWGVIFGILGFFFWLGMGGNPGRVILTFLKASAWAGGFFMLSYWIYLLGHVFWGYFHDER